VAATANDLLVHQPVLVREPSPAIGGRLTALVVWLPLLVAVLLVAFAPSEPGPEPDAPTYLGQADAVGRLELPRGQYPPGLPLLLALGRLLGIGPHWVVRSVAVALVVLVVVAARRVGGPSAGAVAGILCCASPWLLASGRYVMADPLSALLAVAGLVALLSGRPRWAVAATALSVLVRLFSVVGVVALAVAGKRVFVTAALAVAVLTGGWQWMAYGSPLRTGYGDEVQWKPSFVVGADVIVDGAWATDAPLAYGGDTGIPNLVAYPSVVLGTTYVFLPPFVAVAGLWVLWRRRRTEPARYVAVWLVGSLVVALPYFFQAPRFLAPAMMLLTVYAAVGTRDLVARILSGRATLRHRS
jgi:hypothetical protein